MGHYLAKDDAPAAAEDTEDGEITSLYNVSALMKVDRSCVKVCFAIAVTFALSMPMPSLAEVSGYRHIVELEADRTFSHELVSDLDVADPALAARAALALGRTKDARAQAPLAARYHDHHAPTAVRALSLYGLGLLADHIAIDPAEFAAGLHDGAGAVRVAAADGAGRLIAARAPGAASLIAPLVHAIRYDTEPIVRGRAAIALAGFADAAQARAVGDAVLGAYAAERDLDARRHDAWTLGRAFPKTPPLEEIARGLHDPDETIRIEFLVVAARNGDASLAKVIDPLLHDPSWRVAEQAIEAIKRLAGEPKTEHLTAIPAGVVTPPPVPDETTAPLPRPTGLGAPRKPTAAGALLDLPLRPSTAALMTGPMPGLHPRVRIATTKGAIVVRLYPEWAPLTVANFLNLVDRGYYDNLRWFRIVPDFVAQTGDTQNTGEGDAGYTIPAEENPLEQSAGVISMGLNYDKDAAVRDSAGTQFYLTMSPQYHLDRAFTVFGQIESGFNVLGRLIESDTMTKVEELPPD
jgi:peptidyl-prolyl cis-trans isomerase B (cyclophilin B)